MSVPERRKLIKDQIILREAVSLYSASEIIPEEGPSPSPSPAFVSLFILLLMLLL
jgi:hypothetical protein